MLLASRLRRISVRLAAPSLAFVSLAFASFATGSPSETAGSLAGRYLVVSPRATTLAGRVETRGAPDLAAEALLIGPAESGGLYGRFVEIDPEPSGFHLEYDVVGQYVRGLDGVVRIEAQIYLDLIPQGLPVYLHAGELQGRLSRPIRADASPEVADDPGPPDPVRGTFAARIDWF